MNSIARQLLLFTFCLALQSCSNCITGGTLKIFDGYVYNSCGLLNGVYVEKIEVNSLSDGFPQRYKTISAANLYKVGATPNKQPTRLDFKLDLKLVSVSRNEYMNDKLEKCLPMENNCWYVFSSYDIHEKVFVHIDSSGKKSEYRKSYKDGIKNF